MHEYRISHNQAEMDEVAIHSYLTRSYWAQGIPLDLVKKSISNSLCFGVFHEHTQVGFARIVSDLTTFAYLADVYVLEAHQGQGLGKMLISAVMDHPDLQGLRRMMLATHDAHGLYRQYGFTALKHPENLMERHRPAVYEQST